MSFPPCRCAVCSQPLPNPALQTPAEALSLNRDYEAHRRRWHAENPHVPRSALEAP